MNEKRGLHKVSFFDAILNDYHDTFLKKIEGKNI